MGKITEIIQKNSRLSRSFLIRVESIYNQLNTVEKKAVCVILENRTITEKITITELSALAGCSNATLTRLARKLGFGKFADMKHEMFRTASAEKNFYQNINPSDDTKTIIREFFHIAENSLEDTKELLGEEQIETAVQILKKASKILFVGSGDAYSIAYAGYLKFYKAGFDAWCYSDYDTQLIAASKLKEDDAIVVISHSGRTKQIDVLLRLVEAKGVKVISIVSHPLSKIGKMSDVVLLTPTFTHDIYNELIAQRIPALAIIEILYILLIFNTEDEHIECLKKAKVALKENKL